MKWFSKLLIASLCLSYHSPFLISAESKDTSINAAYQKKIEEIYEEEISYYLSMNYPAEFGYSLYDIDQNGIDELLLLEDKQVKHIYTFMEATQEVIFLEDLSAQFTVRDYSLITTDGIVFKRGSNGAMFTVYSAYEFTDSGNNTQVIYDFTWEYIAHPDRPYYRTNQPNKFYTEEEFLDMINGRHFDTELQNAVKLEILPFDQ